MNKKQKTCLLVSMATMVVMGLFPPWVIQSREINRLGNRWECKYITEPGPYSWIGTPPIRPPVYERVIDWDNSKWIKFADLPVKATTSKTEDILRSAYARNGGRWNLKYKQELKKREAEARFIDLYRLGLQYFVVAVVTAGLIIIFRDEKATKQ